MKRTVLVADDESIIRMDLCETLKNSGYNVVGEAADGFDAVTLCRKFLPDLVLMDIKMPLLDGLKASKIICNEKLSNCVILVTSYSDIEFVEKAKDIGIMGYIVKPFKADSIMPNLELMYSKSMEIKELKDNFNKTQEALLNRKIIEKAKGKVMLDFNFSEQEAHNYLRKVSMDKRMSISDVSKAFLEIDNM